MRKIVTALFLVLLVGLVGVATANAICDCPSTRPAEAEKITNLLAGKYTDVGDVYVWNDESCLYVWYETNEMGWYLTEAHLDVQCDPDEIPQTKKGNPIPGQFAYSTCFEETDEQTNWCKAISREDLECSDCDEVVTIAAHAVVWTDDQPYTSETAWGDGTRFTTKGNWGMYFSYTVICGADLEITKEVMEEPPYSIGDEITWVVTVTNNGPDTAANVVVEEDISGLVDVVISSVTPSTGTFVGTTWTVGDLASGASETLTIVTNFSSAGDKTNAVTASSDTMDPVSLNNAAEATVTIQEVISEADVSVTKAYAPGTYYTGDDVVWTVTVTNNGPDTAVKVMVEENISGLVDVSISSVTPSIGTFVGTTWTVGNLTNGNSATLTIVTNFSSPGDKTNAVTVSTVTMDPVSVNNAAEATVKISEIIPSPGADIVVFNDINPFDNGGMSNANNVLLVQNLVNYTTAEPRGSGNVVWFDRGRDSKCGGTGECSDSSLDTMRMTITGLGYTIIEIGSTSGSITTIPPDVKVIFLWNPLVPYTTDEINVFKQFADDGGRVVFIGEWDAYYGSGIALENQFLLDMGAVMTNIGNALDCGYNNLPAASLRPHQITTGMDGVRIACASIIVPGPDDYPLFYDSTNTSVLAGVAKIDVTPLPG